MKNVRFLLLGIFFGIVLSKAEIISWYRIYEMFKFQSFHMYGIIGSAIAISAVLMYLFKKKTIKDIDGNAIQPKAKEKGFIRTLLGGSIFGLGWALSGACVAPVFVLLGFNPLPAIIIIVGAVLGSMVYGILHKKLPH
ncbi:YeeE/YedE thiosulfate transporter family protein [Tenacibaculum sp. IB213877]|uniref:YeeE/YedE thiosulfate transporter family protein n=1 Tax=Tenacibaculum sp. IB213877 TaxID=3097351 RepID=UPI002A59CBB2|nr:YeeE/YedE thiosulfate transporter family protein [Tenacibaculum sp. IB213877]MDY0781006.1 YeeE/YedE thiosulfate transporter family protein [Tenacibaculum sp. IB213877]